MSVNIYIGRDLLDHTRLPETSHESRAIREIYEYLWKTWHHGSKRHYAIVANPKRTSTGRELTPDMVIISQLGLGVIELKDNAGDIDCRNSFGPWKAGKNIIRMNENKYQTPRQQVYDYAEQIRQDLMSELYFPGESHQWDDFNIHTAVCFTHPEAKIDDCRKFVHKYYPTEKWEKFDILKPEHVHGWAFDLRFGVGLGPAMGHELFSWTSSQVDNIAKTFFGAREWQDITSLMPKEEPFAYLGLEEDGRILYVYKLYGREPLTVGREPTLQVVIPETYNSTSRRHACLTNTSDGVLLEDLSSANGTYVGSERITTTYLLQNGERISLGTNKENRKACVLIYSQYPILPTPASTTIG